MGEKREDRWQHLVQAAFELDQTPLDEQRFERALQFLEGELAVFDKKIEPLEDFEGFAVRRLLLAMRRVLEGQEVN